MYNLLWVRSKYDCCLAIINKLIGWIDLHSAIILLQNMIKPSDIAFVSYQHIALSVPAIHVRIKVWPLLRR